MNAPRRIVSLSAVKTGLTGRTVLLSLEEAAPYQAIMAEYEKSLQPVGVEERALVQSIVDCRWRLDRVPGLRFRETVSLAAAKKKWPNSDAFKKNAKPRKPRPWLKPRKPIFSPFIATWQLLALNFQLNASTPVTRLSPRFASSNYSQKP